MSENIEKVSSTKSEFIAFRTLQGKFRIGDKFKLNGDCLKVVKIRGNVIYCKKVEGEPTDGD